MNKRTLIVGALATAAASIVPAVATAEELCAARLNARLPVEWRVMVEYFWEPQGIPLWVLRVTHNGSFDHWISTFNNDDTYWHDHLAAIIAAGSYNTWAGHQ